MPFYDYRCTQCDYHFEARHSMNEGPPACPACGHVEVQRLITSAPAVTRGILADAGDSRGATKEQLRSKWAEETPKLRKKLVDKLGEERVNQMAPTLNTNYDE